jgi:O-antigen/teichoic acid export membrane protein
MFRGAATLGCFGILGAIYYNADMLILQKLVPPDNVAWYAAAYRLFNAAVMLVGLVLGTVLYPILSRLSVTSREGLRQVVARWFAFLLASGVFSALAIVMAADQVVALLYPARAYGEAATTLRLLAPGIAAMYANGIFYLTLLGIGLERRLLVMAAVLAVLNPLANLVLIPLLQQNGAALITSATELIVLAWVLAATPRDLRGAANPKVVMKVLVGAIPAAACLWLLRDSSVLVAVPAAAVVYAAVLIALKTVPARELVAMRGTVNRPHPGTEPLDGVHAISPGTAEP